MYRLRHKYQAGTYIELNDGFNSGTNFVAEINPCVITRTIIAAKTNNDEDIENDDQTISTQSSNDWLKIYPTLLPSGNAITIEANEILDNAALQVFDLQSRLVNSYNLNGLKTTIPTENLRAGMYIVKAQDSAHWVTQKIIIQ